MSDPYLAGVIGAESVKGLQSKGVIATTKHFIVRIAMHSEIPANNTQANEQEANRQPGQAFIDFGIDLGFNESVSENLDG
jgi:beta-glucosidase-like glycosyl hydrolase